MNISNIIKPRAIVAPVALAAAVALSGCGVAGMSALYQAEAGIATANNMRHGVQAYYAYKMIATMHKPLPVYKDAEVANFHVSIRPREGQDAKAITTAMNEAMAEYARQVFDILDLPIEACAGDCPEGNRVTTNFVEEGYHDDFVNRLAMGGKLRGEQTIIAVDAGEIRIKNQLEMGDSYAKFVGILNRYMAMLALTTVHATQNLDKGELQELNNKVMALDPVPEQYKDILEQSV